MSNLTTKQRERIDSIPHSGEWWRSSTRESYRKAFARLLSLGMAEDEAGDFLDELYNVTSEEYGA